MVGQKVGARFRVPGLVATAVSVESAENQSNRIQAGQERAQKTRQKKPLLVCRHRLPENLILAVETGRYQRKGHQRGTAHEILAGIEPPGIFRSSDAGQSWQPLNGFNEHPDRPHWSPAKGGLAVHSVQVDPTHSEQIYAALSAGGIYRSADNGATWQGANHGIRAPYLAQKNAPCGQCVHRLLVHPAKPGRCYQQSHHGTYVSDDYGDHWQAIDPGLPSDFGYALATDPADPDVIYCVPEESSQFRATVDGRLRVYRSRDAGKHWEALSDGLPQENVFVTILRDGLASDGANPLGLYLGTSSGHLFASRDGGNHWRLLAGFLPGILSVRATQDLV